MRHGQIFLGNVLCLLSRASDVGTSNFGYLRGFKDLYDFALATV